MDFLAGKEGGCDVSEADKLLTHTHTHTYTHTHASNLREGRVCAMEL